MTLQVLPQQGGRQNLPSVENHLPVNLSKSNVLYKKEERIPPLP